MATTLKKIGKFLCSMRFAMVLLVFLASACLAGSLIPQGETAAVYTGSYPKPAAGLILALGLDDVFHAWWFAVLAILLCLSLILCNLIRLPALIRRAKDGFSYRACASSAAEPILELGEKPSALFRSLGFFRVEAPEENVVYAARNRLGIFGAWLCHLGMLVLILGFGLGQLTQFDASVYGIPGQTKPIPGTDYAVTIEDFEILLRPDETVDQYTTTLTVSDGGVRTAGGVTQVNHPCKLFGMKFYQNSTGWGADFTVEKDGSVLQQEFLCAGELAHVKPVEGLTVFLRAFYPDYAEDDSGMPMTKSSVLSNPAYLYMLYYGEELLGMNVLTAGQVITVDDYTISFHDPQPYTLIQVKRDPFEGTAALGGGIILAALLLAFYCPPMEVWAVRDPDRGAWQVFIRSRKAEDRLRRDLLRAAERSEYNVSDH